MAADQKTRLNKPWVIKMVIFAGVLIFFGFYGLYDAMISYPARGQNHADFTPVARARANPTPCRSSRLRPCWRRRGARR